MKYGRGLLFLTVALSVAAPAFADKITADFRDGDRGSVYTQALPDAKGLQGASVYRNSSLSTFKEEGFRSEFSPIVLMVDFNNHSKISDLDMLLKSGLAWNGHQVSLFDLRRNHNRSWGRDGGKDWDNHNRWERDGNEGAQSVIVTPEPGSPTLLLFGLAGLAMIGYRRDALKSAI